MSLKSKRARGSVARTSCSAPGIEGERQRPSWRRAGQAAIDFNDETVGTFALSSPRRPIPRHVVFYRKKPRDVLRVMKHFNVMNVMYFNTNEKDSWAHSAVGWAGSTRVSWPQSLPAEGWVSIHQDANRDGTGRFFVVGFRRFGRNAVGDRELQQYSAAPFPRDLALVFYWLGCLGARHSLIAPVVAARREDRAIGGKRDGVHGRLVSFQGQQFLSRDRVPQAHQLVAAGRGQRQAVGAKGDAEDIADVAFHRRTSRLLGHVPQRHRSETMIRPRPAFGRLARPPAQ